MPLPTSIANALTALATSIANHTAGGLAASAVSGVLSWNGLGPKIVLSTPIDPKDIVRASGVFTVTESTTGLANANRVFTFDEVLGVSADGVTLQMQRVAPRGAAPSVSVGGGSHAHGIYVTDGGVITCNAASISASGSCSAPSTSFTLVSSTITLLTKYHQSI